MLKWANVSRVISQVKKKPFHQYNLIKGIADEVIQYRNAWIQRSFRLDIDLKKEKILVTNKFCY